MSNLKYFVYLCTLGILLLVGCGKSPIHEKQSELISEPVIEDDYVYRHRDSAAGGNDREAYIWEVMKHALDATAEDFGPYTLESIPDINQVREDYEVMNDTGVVTVISDSLNQDNLDNLSMLKFPVMRDLLGYRVFLIDKSRSLEFSKIKNLEDLKKYEFGIGLGWNDKIILEHSGIGFYEEPEYKMLFKNVSEGVIDIFSRGINEVGGEFKTFSPLYENLMIEETVLLYYPLPRYYWFSTSEYGQKLQKRLEIGLKRIVENGKLEEVFNRYFSENLKQLHLKERTLIRLENPLYTDDLRENDTPYHFNPFEIE